MVQTRTEALLFWVVPLRTTAHFACRGLSPDAPLSDSLCDLVRVRPRSGECLPVPEGARLSRLHTSDARSAPFIGRTFDPATAFYRRSVLRRSKTAWPSRSRMRKATVLGGKARFRGGDNGSGHVRRLNFDLAQDRQSTTRRSANKLNPKRLRLRSEDALQFI